MPKIGAKLSLAEYSVPQIWAFPADKSMNIEWNELKTIFRCQLTHVGGLIHQKMRLRALLFDLWPFENSASFWEGFWRPSQYLLTQPIYLQILRRQGVYSEAKIT